MNNDLKRCSFCGEEILAVATKCKHCSSMLDGLSSSAPLSKPASNGEVLEVLLLAIPVAATLLIWFWVSGMNLLQSPGDTLAVITLATVLGTAIVAAMEASKVGMKSDRQQGTYGPTAWFFIIALLWIVGYPVYLFKRKHFGLANRLVLGLLVAVLFVGSSYTTYAAIETQVSEIQTKMEQLQQQLGSLGTGASNQVSLSAAQDSPNTSDASSHIASSDNPSQEPADQSQPSDLAGVQTATTSEPNSQQNNQDMGVAKSSPTYLDLCPGPACWVNASELISAYEQNTIDADNMFKGKQFHISGTVADVITDKFNHEVIDYENDENELQQASATLDDSDKHVDIRKGDTVGLDCTGNGDVGKIPLMKDCSFDDSSRPANECISTTITEKGTRLEDTPGSGSWVGFKNGSSQVSYDTVSAVEASVIGDPINLCLVSFETNCPPGDDRGKTRGKTYKATNMRTGQSWVLPDSEHECGGA